MGASIALRDRHRSLLPLPLAYPSFFLGLPPLPSCGDTPPTLESCTPVFAYNSDREQEFHFDDFIKRFANPKVVIAYCKLLSHYRTNSPATNQQNIMHDCYSLPKEKVDGTLKELARLATFVVRKFVAAAQENKIVFAELLFWKNTKDAYELVHGYGSGSKKPSKVAWTEEQVYELKVLYERYKEEMTPDKDVVDLILEHMIDDSRTRRSVLLQLKHLGLIDNVKAFTKKAKANAPWRGEDVIELRELFEKYRESTDIMGQIMEHLSVKRPRHRVVDKLLEIGLVCNRVGASQEAGARRWPRRSGSSGGRTTPALPPPTTTTMSASTICSRVAKTLCAQPSTRMAAVHLRTLPADLLRTRQLFAPCLERKWLRHPEALRTVLSKLVETGCKESLEWLLSSLEDALEDWDPEDPSSVPLVPILEAHHSSMENSDFCSLLRTMGIQPPADEQEAYWRIPADMTTTMLNSRVTVVKRALEGDYGAPLLVVGSASNEAGSRTHLDRFRFRWPFAALLQKKRARQDNSSDTDSDEVGFARRDQRKRKRPRARDTREGRRGASVVQPEPRNTVPTVAKAGTSFQPTHPLGRLPTMAAEEECPPSPPTAAEPIKKRKRATLVVDSDEERESSKRAELVDVDSEEDPGPLVIADDETASGAGRAAKGGRLVVLDDSDDEDVVVNSSGAVADRGVANGDAGLDGASGDVIDLDNESEMSDSRRRRSSESPTGIRQSRRLA
ncbi:hypothetical protein MTO96_032373 [Rhipicephalus appendiculatus]